MRIVFLADDFPPQSFGGAGISTYDLALGMKGAGQEVSIITTCRKLEEAGESEYQGLRIFKIANDYSPQWRAYLSLYNPSVLKEVEKILKEISPDVVHVNNVHFYLSYCSIKLSKKYAKAVVITLRDAMSFSFGKLVTKQYLEKEDARVTWLLSLRQSGRRWNPFRNLFIKYYLKQADKVLAVSKALKEALEQNDIREVEVIHTGTTVEYWKASDEEKLAFKEKYHLENKKIVFFAGRLNEAKGSEIIDKTMTKVKIKIPEAHLFVAGGSGDWLSRDEMRLAYAVSDIVMVPSVCFDALPRAVLEASASGKPVISTPYGGAKEIIEDGHTGYIVDPFNTDEMADKVVDLLQNPDKEERFGQAGRHRIQESFNQNDTTQSYLSVYNEAIARYAS